MSTIGARPEKKGEDRKSKPFRFRLHPESTDKAERDLYAEMLSRMNGRGSIRQYLIDLYRKAERLPAKEKPMPIIDTSKIMKKLEAILARLQGMAVVGSLAAQPQESVDYDDDFLSSLDRILDTGMSADAIDSDELRYVSDEE